MNRAPAKAFIQIYILPELVPLIIEFQTSIKEYSQKIANHYRDFNYSCPFCGARHAWARQGFYSRYVMTIKDDAFVLHSLDVLRLICHSCGTTHAILPYDVIPYEVHSFSLILEILTEVFVLETPAKTLKDDFYISYQMIYYLISKARKAYATLYMCLRILGFYELNFFKSIFYFISRIEKSSNDFLSHFFHQTRSFVFMVRSHNAAVSAIRVGSCFD